MNAVERLRGLVRYAPEGSSLTLPVAVLAEVLEELEAPAGCSDSQEAVDLTVQDLSRALSRSPSTIRGWLSHGTLSGYRLRGREWRVPRNELSAFLERERATGRSAGHVKSSNRRRRGSSSLADWRRVRAQAG